MLATLCGVENQLFVRLTIARLTGVVHYGRPKSLTCAAPYVAVTEKDGSAALATESS